MREPATDPTAVSTYECYECGTTREAESARGCPDCGGTLRNTATPLE
jgi:hypothetical protein